MSVNNGLLMLWKAAEELEGSEIENMIIKARTRRNISLEIMKSRESSSQNGKKAQIPIRHSHNELEKCRRAHLRTCMERLKKVLKFDQDSVPSRVTMLSVLKKASTTIHHRERSIHAMNIKETMAKNRFVELTNRLNNLQRQMKKLRNVQAVNYAEFVKADRMRNYSECSVLTTSSDDSGMDAHGRLRQLAPHQYEQQQHSIPVRHLDLSKLNGVLLGSKRQQSTDPTGSNIFSKTISATAGSGTMTVQLYNKCSSPNSNNSCDSGFEESQQAKKLSLLAQTRSSVTGVPVVSTNLMEKMPVAMADADMDNADDDDHDDEQTADSQKRRKNKTKIKLRAFVSNQNMLDTSYC